MCIYTLIVKRKLSGTSALHDPYDICACAQLRKAARALTQHYEAALRPCGLKITQFSILRTLARTGAASLTVLAERLELDRTTLTRNLRPLERGGLVETGIGSDSRTRIVRLSPDGQQAIAAAEPFWKDAQRRIVDGFGADSASQLFEDLHAISDVARHQGEISS